MDEKPQAVITLTFDSVGLKIEFGGAQVSPDQLILGSHYLRRTADQLLDSASIAQSQRTLVKAAAIPDDLKRRD